MYEGQLQAYALTLVSEAIVAALLARSFGMVWWKAAAAGFFGSLFSHPIVWWSYHELFIGRLGYWPTFAIVEAFAVSVEAPFYRALGARTWSAAFAFSFVVNAASVLAGFAMYAIQGAM